MQRPCPIGGEKRLSVFLYYIGLLCTTRALIIFLFLLHTCEKGEREGIKLLLIIEARTVQTTAILLSYRRCSENLLGHPELLHGRDGGDVGRVHDGAVQVDGGAERRNRRRRLSQQGEENRR